MAASPEITDLDVLLAPLAGENTAGEDVQYTAHDVIKELRRADPNPEIKRSEWSKVTATASEILAKQSKDLKVAVWLTEALIRLHGFPALSYGSRLITELLTRFWENLYPQISNDDLSHRIAPIEWMVLEDNLPSWIRSIPLTQRASDNYNWWQRQSSGNGKGDITAAQFNEAVNATPRGFYKAAEEDLKQAQEELERLKELINEKFKKAGPSFMKVEEAFQDCQIEICNLLRSKEESQSEKQQPPKPSLLSTLFKTFTGQSTVGEPQARDDERSSDAPTDVVPLSEPKGKMEHTAMSANGQLHRTDEPESRDDAFRRIEIIAKYLKRIEPHSPVPYLLERAIRWGRMPLENWLNEVIQNDDSLKRLRDTLGIKEGPTN